MTLLDQHTPILRYFSPARMALVALTSDGLTLIRYIEDKDWKIAARKIQSLTFQEWFAIKQRNIAALPAWAIQVEELPSLTQLQDWLTFSDMEWLDFTVTGIPNAGSLLVLRRQKTLRAEELLHIAESEAAAQYWLTKHPNPGAIIQRAARILEPAH